MPRTQLVGAAISAHASTRSRSSRRAAGLPPRPAPAPRRAGRRSARSRTGSTADAHSRYRAARSPASASCLRFASSASSAAQLARRSPSAAATGGRAPPRRRAVGRRAVQGPSSGGAKVVDDGRPVQRGGRSAARRRAPAARSRRPREQALQCRRRIETPAIAPTSASGDGPSDDRERHHELPCGAGRHRASRATRWSTRGRGRGQVAVALGQPGGFQFGEQGADVSAWPPGVAVQPFRGPPVGAAPRTPRRGSRPPRRSATPTSMGCTDAGSSRTRSQPSTSVPGLLVTISEDPVAAQPVARPSAASRATGCPPSGGPRRRPRPDRSSCDQPVDELEARARRVRLGFEPVASCVTRPNGTSAPSSSASARSEGERGRQPSVAGRAAPSSPRPPRPRSTRPGAARLRVLGAGAQRGELRGATDEGHAPAYSCSGVADQAGGERVAAGRVDQQEAAGGAVDGVVVGRDRLGDAHRDPADVVDRELPGASTQVTVLAVEPLDERATIAWVVRVPCLSSSRAPGRSGLSASQHTVASNSAMRLRRVGRGGDGGRRGRCRRRRPGSA